jgi:anaerobic magnesium-protoporphyrin IX monomethyl ester cyclase
MMNSRKKVLLIYPGNIHAFTKRMPLSVLFLAEALIKEGFEPRILDMQVDSFDGSMLENVVCVGISTLTGEQIKYGLEVAALIRSANPGLPVVWGGIHPSIIPEQTIRHPLVDIVAVGEGETAFPALVKALDSKNDMESVNNLVFEKDGRIIRTPVAPFIEFNRKNELPYDLLSLSKYQTKTRFEYQSSRGCPHGCLFCYNKGFNLFKWRSKSSGIVLDELEEIQKRFNTEYLYFVDDEFFINKRRAFDIVKGMVDRGMTFKWKASVRIDAINTFDDEFLDLIYRSGGYEMPTGAESGSQQILDLVKKKIGPDDILQSARHIKNSKIILQYSFMGGFPGDTLEHLHATIDCIDALWKIHPGVKINGLFFATPFPGTDLFELAVHHGYKPPKSLEEWGDIDFIMNYRNLPYIDKAFARQLVVFAFIIRFKYLWMHSASFLQNAGNRKTGKYWAFLAFHILFKPFEMLFTLRWKLKWTKFPMDIAAATMLLSRFAA